MSTATLQQGFSVGHCFIGFDLFGDTTGFRFTATNGNEQKMQGDEISIGNGITLSVAVPVSSRVVLLKDGKTVQDESAVSTKDYVVNEKGSYRIEVYLPQLPGAAGAQPWIISNPIYVR